MLQTNLVFILWATLKLKYDRLQTWVSVLNTIVNTPRKEVTEIRQTWLCTDGESVNWSNQSRKQVGKKYQKPLERIYDLLALLAII